MHSALRAAPDGPGRHRRPTRRTGRWRRRLLAYRDVDIVASPAPSPEDARCLLLVHGRCVIGSLTYRLCEHCSTGVITAAEFSGVLRGGGLGTRAMSSLRARHPGISWCTVLHRRATRVLMHRLRIPETSSSPCRHLGAGPRPA
ncbi:hypothetical protein ACFYYR_26575 [Streptomyces sp. NPDC001922]|uniref:hypothetical protein n=1 Tax=Streptomyces sp. NPDC001922 TaxID=3364624 RepID=UPI0036783DBF